MKKNIITLVPRSLIALLLTCGLTTAADTPRLQNLRHTVLSPTTEQVVLQLNGSYSPKVFTLKGETPRVIFDFADMTHNQEVKSVTTTNGSIVKRVRVGMHTDDSPKTRVVFDLVTLKGVSYTQKFDEKNSSLVIQLTGPEKAAAQHAQKGQQPVEKTAGTQPAEPAESLQDPGKTAQADRNVPLQSPRRQNDQAREVPSEQTKKDPLPVAPQPPELVVETAAPVKPESPKPGVEATSAPMNEAAEVAAEKMTAEKPLTPSPDQAKPETRAEAKTAGKTEKPQAAGDAQMEKTIEETTAATVTRGKKEEKKVETAATKEPPRSETAVEPLPTAKTDATSTDDKSKTEMAKASTIPGKTADGPQLEYVKFDATSPKGEMVLFKLNGFHPPAVHGVEEGIPRVICDFNNTKLTGTGKNLIKTDGKFVKVIRTSKTKKPEKVRVVIDLEPNRSYDLQQVFFKEDNLFVIIVNTVKK